MNIGRLRHRITLQRLTQTRNEYGETVEDWHTYAIRWAEVKPLSGKEQYLSQQVAAIATIEIWLRFMSAINVADRVIDHRGHVLDIVFIQDIGGRGTTMKLLCKEMVL